VVPDSAAGWSASTGSRGSRRSHGPGRSLRSPPVAWRGRAWHEVPSRDDVRFVDPAWSSAPGGAARPEGGAGIEGDVDSDGAAAQRLGDDRRATTTELALTWGCGGDEQQLLDLRAQARDLDVRSPTGTICWTPAGGADRGSVGVEAAEQLAIGWEPPTVPSRWRWPGSGPPTRAPAAGSRCRRSTCRERREPMPPPRSGAVGLTAADPRCPTSGSGTRPRPTRSLASVPRRCRWSGPDRPGRDVAFSADLVARTDPGAGPDQAAGRAGRRREPAMGAGGALAELPALTYGGTALRRPWPPSAVRPG
jgi:hypothetical protein